MKVILLTEVKGKGGEGDVIDVRDGFANNYLLPQKKALRATKGNLKQLENRKHNIAAREEKRIAEATATKAALEAAQVKVIARVGEEGVLFGSVTSAQIAEAIKEQAGIELSKRDINLKHAIKTAGEHVVTLALYRDIKATVTVLVGDETTFAAPAAEEEVAEAEEAAVEAPAEEADAE